MRPAAAAICRVSFLRSSCCRPEAGARRGRLPGWRGGQEASVARRPAASARVSHFLARCGIRFLPKVALPRSLSIPSLCAPPVPTLRPGALLPALAGWLSVIQDAAAGEAVRPSPPRPSPPRPSPPRAPLPRAPLSPARPSPPRRDGRWSRRGRGRAAGGRGRQPGARSSRGQADSHQRAVTTALPFRETEMLSVRAAFSCVTVFFLFNLKCGKRSHCPPPDP